MEAQVLGARGSPAEPEARLARARDLGDVQLLDARLVCGRDHLLSAAEHAERAMHQGTNVAKSLTMEFVVYASGERQIADALAKMGIRSDTTEFAVVVFAGDPAKALGALGLAWDDAVLEPTAAKLLAFGITEAELATLPPERAADLVLERVALVDLLK
ncbi:MAG TPA: KEOPS complex subunit Cgi121 [Thermoplasmata archaeon]|nr:KEOPS complex subunit Cgi121 [Thermoplasmata archaeon]